MTSSLLNAFKKITVVFLLVLTNFSTAFAARAGVCRRSLTPENQFEFDAKSYLKTSAGRSVFYREFAGDPKKPTLVLLPGINRAMPESYSAIKSLMSEGYNLLLVATSSHWQSLADPGATNKKTSQSGNLNYSHEIDELLLALKIKKPILVSLSYSSRIAADSQHPKILVAPLVTASDSNPQAASAAQAWENMLALNPFLGPTLIRQFRDSNYQKYWSQVVEATLKEDPKSFAGVEREKVVAGYIELSKSTENFDLRNSDLNLGNSADFVLGENETQISLRHQLEAALSASSHKPTRVILVRHAEHNVAESQPVAYVQALNELLSSKAKKKLEVGVINPKQKSRSVQWLTESQAKAVMDKILSLPENTDSADLSEIF